MTATGFWARLERLERADPDRRTAVFWIDRSEPGWEAQEERVEQMRAAGRRKVIVYYFDIRGIR